MHRAAADIGNESLERSISAVQAASNSVARKEYVLAEKEAVVDTAVQRLEQALGQVRLEKDTKLAAMDHQLQEFGRELKQRYTATEAKVQNLERLEKAVENAQALSDSRVQRLERLEKTLENVQVSADEATKRRLRSLEQTQAGLDAQLVNLDHIARQHLEQALGQLRQEKDARLAALDVHVQEMGRDLRQKQAATDDKVQQLERLEKAVENAQAVSDSRVQRLERLEHALEEMQKMHDETANRRMRNLEQAQANVDGQLNDLSQLVRQQLASHKESMETMRSEVVDHVEHSHGQVRGHSESQVAALQADLAQRCQDLDSRASTLHTNLSNLQAHFGVLQGTVAQVEAQVTRAPHTWQAADDEIKKLLRNELQETTQALKAQILSRVEQAHTQALSHVDTTRSDILAKEIANLEAHIANLQSSIGAHQSVHTNLQSNHALLETQSRAENEEVKKLLRRELQDAVMRLQTSTKDEVEAVAARVDGRFRRVEQSASDVLAQLNHDRQALHAADAELEVRLESHIKQQEETLRRRQEMFKHEVEEALDSADSKADKVSSHLQVVEREQHRLQQHVELALQRFETTFDERLTWRSSETQKLLLGRIDEQVADVAKVTKKIQDVGHDMESLREHVRQQVETVNQTIQRDLRHELTQVDAKAQLQETLIGQVDANLKSIADALEKRNQDQDGQILLVKSDHQGVKDRVDEEFERSVREISSVNSKIQHVQYLVDHNQSQTKAEVDRLSQVVEKALRDSVEEMSAGMKSQAAKVQALEGSVAQGHSHLRDHLQSVEHSMERVKVQVDSLLSLAK